MKTTSKIALSNLKYTKSRSLLTGLAVMLTTLLLMVLGTVGVFIIQENRLNAGSYYGEYHGAYTYIDAELANLLQHHTELDQIGFSTNLGYMETEDTSANIVYYDETLFEFLGLNYEGSFPTQENEIIIYKEMANLLGYEGTPGSTVSIPIRLDNESEYITEEFVVTGSISFAGDTSGTGGFPVYTSAAYAQRIAAQKDLSYHAFVQIPGFRELGKSGTIDKLEEVGQSVGLEKDRLVINNGYLDFATDPGTNVILVIVFACLLILVFGIFVIYSIFYIGMVHKIREFGTLRALGITKKQLQGVILREGLFTGAIAIPLGILLGFILSYAGIHLLYLKNTARLVITPPIFSFPVVLIVAATSVISIFLAIKKPMKTASSVSPVEAMRYQGEAEKINERKKAKKQSFVRKEIKLIDLILSNMKRNKKQTGLTLISISFSSILFVILAAVLSNMNPEIAARKTMNKGDFALELEFTLTDKAYPENNLNSLQENGVIDDQLIENIRNIPGVTGIDLQHSVMATTPHEAFESNEHFLSITGYSREDYESEMELVEEGVIDYDQAVENNEIICTFHNFMEQDGLAIGDTLQFEIYDGLNNTVTMEATIQAAVNNMYKGDFIIPQEVLDKYNLNVNTVSTIFVYTDQKGKEQESVADNLKALAARDGHIELQSYADILEYQNRTSSFIVYPLYGLLAIITFIGFMNLANTLITSVVTRKREFGILQAIGLSDKQLASMLKAEGLLFTIGTLLIALTAGNLLGIGLFQICKRIGFTVLGSYRFPAKEIAILAAALVLMQIFLSAAITKNVQKESLIERIRYQG